VTFGPASSEARRTVLVQNSQGLHARPCHSIVSRALNFRSDLRIRSNNREVNGKSILELMTLSAGPGTELELIARGADAETLLAELAELFQGCFGEDRA